MLEYLTVEELAPYCRTSVHTLYRRIRAGALSCIRAGGGRKVLIPVEEARRFLAQHGIPIPAPLQEPVEGPTRILAVDDDEKLVRSLTRYFSRKEGFAFQSATSGFAAGLALPLFRPHVVLLDVMLGDMDGRELIKTVRGDSRHGNPRIIAMSGFVRDDEAAALQTLGFDDYLAKPFTLPDLLERIQRVLRKGRT